MKILIVEDSTADQLLFGQFIEEAGARPIAVGSGKTALAAFADERPDLVLLDVVLPDMDGFDVARRLRELERPGEWTPIIFLSALTDDTHIEAGIEAGGDDYLKKPISQIVLGAKIRAMQRLVRMREALIATSRKLDAANQELIRLSACDGLTGVGNRRYFDESLSVEWRRARRHTGPLVVMMCDVDYFKPYNDTYGHRAGDEALRRIAQAISRQTVRPADIVARYGGEEFAVVLPETTAGGAQMVAERIRQGIYDLDIQHSASPLGRITLSIGIAAAPAGFDDAPDELINAADGALYQAKHSGRNRVCLAGKA